MRATLLGGAAAGLLATLVACAPVRVPAPAAGGTTLAAPAMTAANDVAFPEGRGREILMAACTSCHDLREVTKFRGYYTRAQWRDVVATMVEYGAEVEDADVEVLADYLYEHLGRRLTASSR